MKYSNVYNGWAWIDIPNETVSTKHDRYKRSGLGYEDLVAIVQQVVEENKELQADIDELEDEAPF